MSLFEEDKGKDGQDLDPGQATGDPSPSGEQSTDVDQLLDTIKNENGERKYKSIEDALKGAAHAQSFIEQLKSEKAEMERQLADRRRLEELLSDSSSKTGQAADDEARDQVAALTAKDVEAMLEQREQAKAEKAKADEAKSNAQKVKDAAKAAFGAEAHKVLAEKVEELGLSQELADSIAQERPEAFLKMIGIKAKADSSGLASTRQSLENIGKPPVPEKRRFDPFSGNDDPLLKKWRESAERTKARLGQ